MSLSKTVVVARHCQCERHLLSDSLVSSTSGRLIQCLHIRGVVSSSYIICLFTMNCSLIFVHLLLGRTTGLSTVRCMYISANSNVAG
jgi:hypothetical protein